MTDKEVVCAGMTDKEVVCAGMTDKVVVYAGMTDKEEWRQKADATLGKQTAPTLKPF